MGQRVTIVDAFTASPFSGNPAAVCVLGHPTTEAWMQSVAREMGQSETAFCVPLRDGQFELRWFTPACEVALCGHATLATAHTLWEEGRLAPRDSARFITQSGNLIAAPLGRQIELDFPSRPPTKCDAPQGLADGLGVTPLWVGRDQDDYLVLVESESDVQACSPDFASLRRVDTRGIIVTAVGDQEGIDFVSRFFAPRVGIDEDTATGSAHCALTPFWAERLDRSSMAAAQISARGGSFEVELAGDRVKLKGACVTTVRGTLTEDPPQARD